MTAGFELGENGMIEIMLAFQGLLYDLAIQANNHSLMIQFERNRSMLKCDAVTRRVGNWQKSKLNGGSCLECKEKERPTKV